MIRNKPTLDQYIEAVLDKDSNPNIPFQQFLDKHNISSNQFSQAVNHDLSKFVEAANGDAKQVLQSIVEDDDRRKELFRMDEAFLRDQYLSIIGHLPGRMQKGFIQGTFSHPDNIDNIVYIALTHHEPRLASRNRRYIVQEIRRMPSLKSYFTSIKLGGVMNILGRNGENGSALGIINAFDRVYMEKTDDSSLFDLSQDYHIHPWADNFMTPSFYFNNQNNVDQFVYHTLSELKPQLASFRRSDVIQGIKNLPDNLRDYFKSIGFESIMKKASESGEKNLVLHVLKSFDRGYTSEMEDESLFRLENKDHLHEWDYNIKAPNSYWNRKRIRKAIYHTLTQHGPLASGDRDEVIERIKEFPDNMWNYFEGTLGKKITRAFSKIVGESPKGVLQEFDAAYQDKTKNPGLLDTAQSNYLIFNGQSRLIR